MRYSKNEKHYRNASIIADYLNGAKVPDMADHYKITTQRIYTIMKQYRKRKSNNEQSKMHSTRQGNSKTISSGNYD
jgi:Mor family transcriptional regulator